MTSRPPSDRGEGSPNKAQAQKRADRIRAFRAELEELERLDLIHLPPDQREKLSSYHDTQLQEFSRLFDVDVSETQKQMSWGMRIVSLAGALAFCAAVFFFFYRFWGLCSTPVQVAFLVLAPAVALLLTEIAARKEQTLYVASLAALVALACFVLNLTVLGMIFNITPSQNALLACSLFAFTLAYSYGMRLLLVGGILCFASYLSATTGTWSGCYWISFGERPENLLLSGLILFAVPLVAPHRKLDDFPAVYRLFGLLIVFVPILILANWGDISYLTMSANAVQGLYQTLGFVLSGLTVWLGLMRGWTGVVNLGSTFLVVFIYTKMFDWWWRWMPTFLFFLIVGCVALAILMLLKRLRAATQARAS